MKLLADENLARDIVSWLRGAGYDVLYAAEGVPGTLDVDWAATALRECRIILTADKDFGEIAFRDGLPLYGLVLLRLEDLPVPDILKRVQAVWSVVEANPTGQFIVITETKVRVRPLPLA